MIVMKILFLFFCMIFIPSHKNELILGSWYCFKKEVSITPKPYIITKPGTYNCSISYVFDDKFVYIDNKDLNIDGTVKYNFDYEDRILRIGETNYKVLRLDRDTLIYKDTLINELGIGDKVITHFYARKN